MNLEAANRALCDAIGQPPIWCNHGDNRGELFQVPQLYKWAGIEALVAGLNVKGWLIDDIAQKDEHSFSAVLGNPGEALQTDYRESGTLPMAVFLSACVAFGIEVSHG